MTLTEGKWALRLIYEMKTGWRISEQTLAEEDQFTRLKEATQ